MKRCISVVLLLSENGFIGTLKVAVQDAKAMLFSFLFYMLYIFTMMPHPHQGDMVSLHIIMK